jgi:hypothetical protein
MRGRGFLLQVMNGVVAAHYGAQLIINAIAEKGYAHVILATGASQFEMLQVSACALTPSSMVVGAPTVAYGSYRHP